MNSNFNNQGNGNPKYWDIDDILMEEEIVQVKSNCFQRYNGFLDKRHPNNEHIDKDQEYELPFWLALDISTVKNAQDEDDDEDDENSSHVLEISIPTYYSDKIAQNVKSAPLILDARAQNVYYYEFGIKIAEYLEDQGLIRILLEGYLERLKEFIIKSSHLQIKDCNNMVRKMAAFELKIFNSGRQKAEEIRSWKDKQENYDKYKSAVQKLKGIQTKQF